MKAACYQSNLYGERENEEIWNIMHHYAVNC